MFYGIHGRIKSKLNKIESIKIKPLKLRQKYDDNKY